MSPLKKLQLTFIDHFQCARTISPLHARMHLIFTTTLWGRFFYNPHCADEETEDQEGLTNSILVTHQVSGEDGIQAQSKQS